MLKANAVKQAGRATTVGATATPVSQAISPLLGGQGVGELALSGIAAVNVNPYLFGVALLVLPCIFVDEVAILIAILAGILVDAISVRFAPLFVLLGVGVLVFCTRLLVLRLYLVWVGLPVLNAASGNTCFAARFKILAGARKILIGGRLFNAAYSTDLVSRWSHRAITPVLVGAIFAVCRPSAFDHTATPKIISCSWKPFFALEALLQRFGHISPIKEKVHSVAVGKALWNAFCQLDDQSSLAH